MVRKIVSHKMKNLSIAIFMLLCSWYISGCTGSSNEQKANEDLLREEKRFNTTGEILRIKDEVNQVINPETEIEVLAEGFSWSEGPLWIEDGQYLIFSDVPQNRVYKWDEEDSITVFLEPSGYTSETRRGGEPGSNGLFLDPAGQLVLCQHGDRRVARLNSSLQDASPSYSTIVDNYSGKRLNSPNDGSFHPSGELYFTDPPYGLAGGENDPAKELDFHGVYGWNGESLNVVTDKMTRPNGLAFSPDGNRLYVANSDPEYAVWMMFDRQSDGSWSDGQVFFDATSRVANSKGLPDGLKVNDDGIIFATGPGGVYIFSPDADLLGIINTGQPTSNCALGSESKHALHDCEYVFNAGKIGY